MAHIFLLRLIGSAGAIRKMRAQVEKEFGTDFVTLKANAARARSAELAKELKADSR